MISKRLIIPFTLALCLGAIFACNKEETPMPQVVEAENQQTDDRSTDPPPPPKCCLVDFAGFPQITGNGDIYVAFAINTADYYTIRIKRLSDGLTWNSGLLIPEVGADGCMKTKVNRNMTAIVAQYFNNCTDQYQAYCNIFSLVPGGCEAGDVSPVIILGSSLCN